MMVRTTAVNLEAIKKHGLCLFVCFFFLRICALLFAWRLGRLEQYYSIRDFSFSNLFICSQSSQMGQMLSIVTYLVDICLPSRQIESNIFQCSFCGSWNGFAFVQQMIPHMLDMFSDRMSAVEAWVFRLFEFTLRLHAHQFKVIIYYSVHIVSRSHFQHNNFQLAQAGHIWHNWTKLNKGMC